MDLITYRRYPGRTPAIIIFKEDKIVSQVPVFSGSSFDDTIILLDDYMYNL